MDGYLLGAHQGDQLPTHQPGSLGGVYAAQIFRDGEKYACDIIQPERGIGIQDYLQ